MAILTPTELAALRVAVQSDASPIPYTKPVINLGFQAMEDWWDSPVGRAAAIARAAMVSAGAPGATNAEARKVVKHWLRDKFGRGG